MTWPDKKVDLSKLLVPISPYLCVFVSIHPQPPIGFSKIIKDNPGTIMTSGWKNNTGAGIGLTCDPCAMEGVGDQEKGHHHHKEPGYALLLGIITCILNFVSSLLAHGDWFSIADMLRGLVLNTQRWQIINAIFTICFCQNCRDSMILLICKIFNNIFILLLNTKNYPLHRKSQPMRPEWMRTNFYQSKK